MQTRLVVAQNNSQNKNNYANMQNSHKDIYTVE